eukprot:Awhi_evm1s6280
MTTKLLSLIVFASSAYSISIPKINLPTLCDTSPWKETSRTEINNCNGTESCVACSYSNWAIVSRQTIQDTCPSTDPPYVPPGGPSSVQQGDPFLYQCAGTIVRETVRERQLLAGTQETCTGDLTETVTSTVNVCSCANWTIVSNGSGSFEETPISDIVINSTDPLEPGAGGP